MAERHDSVSKISALLVEQCEEHVPVLPLNEDQQFEELGLDWLAHTAFIMRLEEEFSLVINDKEAQTLTSLRAVLAYLAKQQERA